MQGAPEGPHAKFPHVYAIVRFDRDASGRNAATVVKVTQSREFAEQEATRLNKVNQDKQCSYAVQTTRYVAKPEP